MSLARLLARPDFQSNPARAVYRRLMWRARWSIAPRSPWALPLGPGLRIAVAHSGPAALIYYQGCSEPETAAFVVGFLESGMTFVDVGAHFGEYTLLAARAVGARGRVHAFEPAPDVVALLEANVERNALAGVTVNHAAVADTDGERPFAVRLERAVSSLATAPTEQTVPVACVRLDTYWASVTQVPPDLVKVDVEGAELLVLRGADGLLSRPAGEAPTLVVEFSPDNFADFGYTGADLLDALDGWGYAVRLCGDGGRLEPFDPATSGRVNVVASKQPTPA